MGYLDRSFVGHATRPTMAAMTAIGRLRASSRHSRIDIALAQDGAVYASCASAAFDKALLRRELSHVGRYTRGASSADIAADIECAWIDT